MGLSSMSSSGDLDEQQGAFSPKDAARKQFVARSELSNDGLDLSKIRGGRNDGRCASKAAARLLRELSDVMVVSAAAKAVDLR